MRHLILFIATLALAGCDAKPATTDKAADAPADNTKKNERDRGNDTLTPGDQGTSEADRTITQKIRQSVVKSDTLSMTGKNVKIITADGVVTLRGPVKSDQEKTDIAALAKSVDGVKRVDNQLEIAAK
jgi:hyperosmotically inducible protein